MIEEVLSVFIEWDFWEQQSVGWKELDRLTDVLDNF